MNPLPLVIEEGLRFSCHRCGACCRRFVVDLEPDEVAAIARHDWAAEDPRYRDGFTVRGENQWGEPRDELKKWGEACIFLDVDGLCLVEKRLGREAKPRVCRKFPFVFVAAPDGERAAVTIECESRWRSIADGAPVEALRAELEELRAKTRPHRTRWRVQVARDARFLTPEEYLALEARLAAAVSAGPLAFAPPRLAAEVWAARLGGEGDIEGGFEIAGDEQDAFGVALAALAATGTPAADRKGGALAAAVREVASAPGAWRAAIEAADATAGGGDFLRAMLRGWIQEAIPGRNPTAADGVGQMIFGLVLAAATGRAMAGGAPPPLPRLNRAARDVSLFLRGKSGMRLREATGGYEGLVGALA